MKTIDTTKMNWIIDSYDKTVRSSSRKIMRVPRAQIIADDGTEDGILVATDLRPAVAEYLVSLHVRARASGSAGQTAPSKS